MKSPHLANILAKSIQHQSMRLNSLLNTMEQSIQDSLPTSPTKQKIDSYITLTSAHRKRLQGITQLHGYTKTKLSKTR